MIRHKRIARVFALANHRQFEPGRQIHRHVFHRMHRQVGATFVERDFQLFDEQTLAADFGQRDIQNLVAARSHAEDIDRVGWVERA